MFGRIALRSFFVLLALIAPAQAQTAQAGKRSPARSVSSLTARPSALRRKSWPLRCAC
jgi:hypothetical protein